MECILNLTQSPAAAQMFFCADDADAVSAEDATSVLPSQTVSVKVDTSSAVNADKAAVRTRLTLLLALTNSSTRGTALAAAAALSQILAFEPGAASFLALASASSPPGAAAAKETAPKTALDARSPTRRLLTLVADSAGVAASSAAHPDSGSNLGKDSDAEAQPDPDMLARAATALCAFVDAGDAAVRASVRDAGGLRLLEALVKLTVVEQMSLGGMISDAIAALRQSTES